MLGNSPEPGTKAGGGLRPSRAASASSLACSAGRVSVSRSGEVSRGQTGQLRSTISWKLTRSFGRSTAGGTEVSEAAAKNRVKPTPISTSANRRSRLMPPLRCRRSRPISRKLPNPNPSSPANIAILALTITPYAVP